MTKFITVDEYAINWIEAKMIVDALTIAFINENNEETCEKYVKLCQDWENIRDRLTFDSQAILQIAK